jgi:hypothetical protein
MSHAWRHLIRLLLAGLFAGLAPAAAAVPCAGFADVDSSSPFCASLTWLKNEGITVGCGDGTIYCPNDPVSRLGMAALLKRMADATGDAPTQQPYNYALAPLCQFANICTATFPPVPAGKMLRLTSMRAIFFNTNTSAILAVHRNVRNAPLQVYPVEPFGGFYYGSVLNANQAVDLVFVAGESPVLELGIAAAVGGISAHPNNRLGVSGYLVDVP